MLELFPVLSDNGKLTVEDFSRFSKSYSEILQRYLPAVKRVDFAFSAGQAEAYFRENDSAAELMPLFRQVQAGTVDFGIHADYLLLPFDVKGEEKSVAIISEADPLFLQKVHEDWLLEKKTAIEREFLLLKQARVDSQTGLLNLSNLYSLLDTHGATEGVRLILLELAPTRTSSRHFLRYSNKCANLLVNFVPADAVPHYLGQSTFALVVRQNYTRGRTDFESALVSYLKREGCHRVRIGSSLSRRASGDEKDHKRHGRQLLDEAWTALRHAAQRGPFSFCDFAQLAHPEKHPLAPPAHNLVRRLGRLWSDSDAFCLVQFCADHNACSASSVILPHIDHGVVVAGDDDVFVYLDGAKPGEALQWAKKIVGRIGQADRRIDVSAGVSGYPYGDFKKSEMVVNCRKALLHAAFYGKSSAALFDAVSLNISGDIYFSDGDLARAVKEYQMGVKCDSLDVNLHNSLGVALAMMNKLTPALQCFENGLAIDGENFMALYNLGLGEQTRNRKAKALEYLEKALRHYTPEEGGTELAGDLTLQLGILSCELGRYEAALAYLVPWQLENNNTQSAGRVHYYLGEAYHGLKNNRKAMESLQRALRFDEFDDRALCLLGRVYLEEREGDAIALSLCRKSVELEPANIRYMLYLAEVLLRCGSLSEGREYLSRCLKNRECKMEAQLLLGESYAQEGLYRRARGRFLKILEQEKPRRDLYVRAEEGLRKISRERM